MQQQVPDHHREMQQQVGVGALPLLATLGAQPLLAAPPLTPTHSPPQEETLAGSLQPGPGPLVAG